MADNSRITVGGVTYDIKDSVARDIALKFVICTNAANTPEGVVWEDTSTTPATEIIGTLEASASTKGIYLVPVSGTSGKNIHDEYVTVTKGEGESASYSWEKLGSTEAALKGLVTDVTLNKSSDNVLGSDTTFTNGSSAVTFSGGSDDAFVKSYPGVTSNLVKTTITGVDGSESVVGIKTNTQKTASKVTAAADKEATKITTASKTATNLVLGTDTQASKATAGTAVDVAKVGTQVDFNAVNSAITNANGEGLVYNMQVNSETLSFSTVATAAQSVIPAVDNGTITPYTFENVTVPVVTSNTSVTFDAVDSATDVTITQFTAADVTCSEIESETAVTLAKPAASATTVATGTLSDQGTGDAVMTGLGTAVTANAVTGLGTATAAAQTITVGSNDTVSVATYDSLSLDVTKKQ